MRKKILISLGVFILCLGAVFQFSGISTIPDTINISLGDTKSLSFNLPITLEPVTKDVLQVKEQDNSDIEIIPKQEGEENLSVNVFGFPIKNVQVNVYTASKVIPGGQSIGVALYTKGALVVGTSNIKDIDGNVVNPAKEAGLVSGDIIEQANGITVNNADHVMEIINGSDLSTTTKLVVIREGERHNIEITPVQDEKDGSYRLGLWVRDSMAGVGTLSFYDPATMDYAGLGHAIYDNDTGTMLNIKTGEVVESDVYGIKEGEVGAPGEIQGSFDGTKEALGDIESNNDFGIYGEIYRDPDNSLINTPMDTALISEIEVGSATILTTIDDEGVKEYDIQIEKLADQNYPSTKSMVISITDEELLDKTGGVIQGMSGSPILQNGKVVGAVTHVFVNDPTKGYGLYAQWMLEQMD